MINWLRRRLGKGQPRSGIKISGRVTAKIIDANGKVIKTISGHNRWTDGGLDMVSVIFRTGGTSSGGKIVHMRLGSVYSDTSFTYIAASEVNTTNTKPADAEVMASATWSPTISGIKQVALLMTDDDSSTDVEAAYYSLSSGGFSIPTGCTLYIKWTVTVGRA